MSIVLLLWRVPNAVRLSQVAAVVVTSLMCVCSASVLANVVSPSDGAEGAATYIGLVVSVLNCVFGILELVALFVAVMPLTASSLGLQSRTLESVIERGVHDDDDEGGANAVPMLQLPQAMPVVTPVSGFEPTLPPQQHPAEITSNKVRQRGELSSAELSLTTKTTKEEDDEAWAERVIAKVHGREE